MRSSVVVLVSLIASGAVQAQQSDPALQDLVTRVGAYAARYGEQAAVIVAQETYTQQVTVIGAADVVRPMKLIAEFAIVKLPGGGWTGFRDVIEVNGEAVPDRKDRLMSLLTSPAASISEATRIANESSRYNIGPISRNFNTPTAALFFFMPQNLERFTFTTKGSKNIEGVKTTEIAYKESKLPTLVTTRSGKNVPLDGSLWVTDDGTVVRTAMHMEKFADQSAAPDQAAPRVSAPLNPASNNGGRPAASGNVAGMDARPIDSSADIEVTYAKPPGIDVWLPSQMVELYEGVVAAINIRPTSGRTVTRAKYANFKQFGAAGKIVPP